MFKEIGLGFIICNVSNYLYGRVNAEDRLWRQSSRKPDTVLGVIVNIFFFFNVNDVTDIN